MTENDLTLPQLNLKFKAGEEKEIKDENVIKQLKKFSYFKVEENKKTKKVSNK